METHDFQGGLSPTVEDLTIYDEIFKRSLKCKCAALIFCVTGTVLMLLLPLDYYAIIPLTIILPCFMFGYIFVHVAGILTACRGHIDLMADIISSSFGFIGNIFCSIYLLYIWIDWIIATYAVNNAVEGTMVLILSMACLCHTAAMGGLIAASMVELRRRVVLDPGDNEH